MLYYNNVIFIFLPSTSWITHHSLAHCNSSLLEQRDKQHWFSIWFFDSNKTEILDTSSPDRTWAAAATTTAMSRAAVQTMVGGRQWRSGVCCTQVLLPEVDWAELPTSPGGESPDLIFSWSHHWAVSFPVQWAFFFFSDQQAHWCLTPPPHPTLLLPVMLPAQIHSGH